MRMEPQLNLIEMESKYECISGKKVDDLINEEKLKIIDIRDEESFKYGHIPNAININDSNIKRFLDDTSKNTSVLIYCYHGNNSKGAAEYFISQGYKKVYSLDGGYSEYKGK